MSTVSAIVKHARVTIAKITHPTRRFAAEQSTQRLFLVGAIILLATLTFGAIITALGNALFFDGYAADGAFQLLNPLRRLMEGQVIGRDFSFFHGVGVPFIHLPFYILFGQGLFGEELTRWLVSPLLFILSAFCVFYVWRRRFAFALIMSVVVTGLGMILIPFLVLPITSILGVRSVVPVFLLAVLLNQRRLSRPIFKRAPKFILPLTWYELASGALLAAGLLCGTEFGVAAILAFAIARVAYPVEKGERTQLRWLSLARTGVSFAVVLLAALEIITMGHPLEPLRYAFIDIPTDQFWYFGVPPNKYIHLGNVFQTFLGDWRLLVMWGVAAVAAVLAYRVHALKKFRLETQGFLFAWLAGAFAMISMLGYYSNSEASALARMAFIVGCMSLVILAEQWKKPLTYGYEVGKLKKRIKLQPAAAWRGLAIVFIVGSLAYSLTLVLFLKDEFAIGETLRKAKNYVTGVDTNVLGDKWKAVDEMIIPVVESDNTVTIADVNDNGYEHGVKAGGNQIIVSAGEHASFIQPGQIVYFVKAGRQIIRSVETKGDKQYVTLQGDGAELDPAKDAAPAKLIVAEDFKHDNTKVWSLYTGILNAEMGLVNSSKGGYDYIIHALGPDRRRDYVHDFETQQPQYVMSFTHGYFTWEGWMQNSHWDFYSLLDQNYEVVQDTPTYALWKRKDQKWTDQHVQAQSWQKLDVNVKDSRIDLPKLSFENAPDVEAYGRQVTEKQRQHLLDLGFKLDERQEVTREQYDQIILDKLHEQQQTQQFNRENNGPETEALQQQKDREAHAYGEYIKAKEKKEGNSNSTQPELHLPRPKRVVVLVKLDYEVSNPLQSVPVFGKTWRYMVEPNNTYSDTVVSLRPYARQIVFPVVLSEQNADPYLRLNTYSLLPGKGNIRIVNAEWTLLDTSIANLKTLTD
jgi:hypothetical protein